MTRSDQVRESINLFFVDYSIFTNIAAKNGIVDKESRIKLFSIYTANYEI